MRNFEAFTAETFNEVACNGFARGIANAVNKTIELGPVNREVGKKFSNLGIVAHITIKDQFRIEIGSKLRNSVFESFADITESQLGALCMTCLGNAIGNRSIGQDTRNKDFFAGKEAHGL